MSSFQKLTPIKEADLAIYKDALDFVFQNNDVKNVAISGGYGAGKSSIIETYKQRHSHLKFLHVSLAHFESTNDKSELAANNDGALEGKILNQLIHQIPPKWIPRTNFKVKQKFSKGKIIGIASLVMLFIICITYLHLFDQWNDFISTLDVKWLKSVLFMTTNSELRLLAGLFCTALLGVGVFTSVRIVLNSGRVLKRVNLQGNEIEIFEQTKDSYFDKHLNEVLYLFENANVHVIVFEDMDRYNSNLIFEKLREINTLVNNKVARMDKPPIRFLYLVRDDTFVSKDRTKFFDFIIPIVPVIDGSNSYDKFIEHLKLGNLNGLFDELFLQKLSLYVDDMRLLKNICNEFVIYHQRIQSIELDNNKLLALITYKNIFPKDFSDLQLGNGFVYTLFNSKSAFVRDEVARIKQEIRNLQASIDQANGELLNNIDELDAVFFRTDKLLAVNSRREHQFRTRAEFIRELKACPSNVTCFNPNYQNWYSINLEAEFSQLSNDDEYRRRRADIARKSEASSESLTFRIDELRQEESELKNRRLREIITRDNIDDVFGIKFRNGVGHEETFENIKASQYFSLIKFLVRNGYIDETYSDYMTYFYENSLSRFDKIFLRSVSDQVAKEYAFSLKNPQMVLTKLGLADFERPESLNFDLLNYLLKTSDTNSLYLNSMLTQLVKTRNYKFIGEFLDGQIDRGRFVVTMNRLWPGIFNGILNESLFTNAQKTKYAVETLLYSAVEDIGSVNQDNCLSTFISAQPSFLNIEGATSNITKLVHGLKFINVQFSWIDYSTCNKDLFYAVYRNDLYYLNFELICLMLEVAYKLPNTENFKKKNYTLIVSKPEEPLTIYVKKNFKRYIDIVLESCDGIITDDELTALEILNNPAVDVEQKKTYISFLNTEIVNIKDIHDCDVWNHLLQHGRVRYSVENILNYFFLSSELDPVLINFINSDATDLLYSSIEDTYGDDSWSKFYKAIVACSSLNNDKYESILRSVNRSDAEFEFRGIHAEKIAILIRLGVIVLNYSNLLFMRENYAQFVIPFIVSDMSTYTETIGGNADLYDLQEMLMVLDEDIDDEFKRRLLELIPGEVSIHGKNYSDVVKLHILNHNLNLDDLPFLLTGFSLERKGIKAVIKRIAIENLGYIIQQGYSIDRNLLAELLTENQIKDETKRELLATCLPTLSLNQLVDHLYTLGMNDFLSLFDGKRPKFSATSTNRKILSTFESNGWITKFVKEENYYRAIGRKIAGFSVPRLGS